MMKKTRVLVCAIVLFFAAAHLHGQFPAPGGNRGAIGDALDRMTRALHAADAEPTLEDAYFLGRAVAAHIFSLYRPYVQNPALTRYLNKICQTLVINAPNPAAFRGHFVVILDSPGFNAFASPGGHVFLTRGLVNAATTEDMLAAVIAHELAHVMLGHGLSMIREMAVFAEAAEMAARAADFVGNPAEVARLMSFRESVSGLVETLVRTGYSREQEFAADRKAVELMVAAGYDPRALTQMLEILQREQGRQTDGFFATHPPPVERIRNVEAAIARHRVAETGAHRLARFLAAVR